MAEKKRYVVWEGKTQGIFESRDQVQPLVNGIKGAKYKSFKSLNEAEKAQKDWREPYYQPEKKRNEKELPFIKTSIAVDAACSSSTGILEYQGIDLITGETIFHQKFPTWTNNIWEFLALVHWLSYLQKEKKADYTLYSDSKIAINRIYQGKCKTNLSAGDENSKLFEMIKRAETWLKNNTFSTQILKRNTKERWEIPADFGRK